MPYVYFAERAPIVIKEYLDDTENRVNPIIAAGLRKLPDVDADRRAAARRYAAAFTPEATTAATLAVLREVLR